MMDINSKTKIMKSIINNIPVLLFSFFVLMGIGFSSCDADSEDVVVLKTLEEYKSELSEIISTEKAKVLSTVVGYNKGDFRSATLFPADSADYMDALLEAEQILNKADLTIADVMEANYIITGPGNSFNAEIFISDRRPLHERIVYADTLRVHTPIGTEVGSAPEEAHNTFVEALDVAKFWRSSSITIERQVTEAVDTLNFKLSIFEAAIIK